MKLQRRDIVFFLFTVALVAFKWQDIRGLIAYASDLGAKHGSQIFLIPFVTAGLIFMRRGEVYRNVRYGVPAGTLVIAAGLVFPAFFQSVLGRPLVDEDNRLTVAIASLLISWVGGFLFFYGFSAFRVALFPLLFLAFSIPIPSVILDPLITVLQRGSAEVAYILIKLPGTLIYREVVEGPPLAILFTMSGPAGVLPINVAPECSGIRSFISMLILALVGGQLLLKTQWKRMALVAIAIPIMIFKNGVRIATLSLLGIHVDPSIVESRLHQEGGIPFFILGLVLIYPILKILMRSETKESAGEPVLQGVNL